MLSTLEQDIIEEKTYGVGWLEKWLREGGINGTNPPMTKQENEEVVKIREAFVAVLTNGRNTSRIHSPHIQTNSLLNLSTHHINPSYQPILSIHLNNPFSSSFILFYVILFLSTPPSLHVRS